MFKCLKRNNFGSIVRESFLDLNLFFRKRRQMKGNRLLLLNIHETLRKRAYVLLIGGEGGDGGGGTMEGLNFLRGHLGQGKLSLFFYVQQK